MSWKRGHTPPLLRGLERPSGAPNLPCHLPLWLVLSANSAPATQAVAAPPMCQVHSCLRAFAPSIPSFWSFLPPDLLILHTLTSQMFLQISWHLSLSPIQPSPPCPSTLAYLLPHLSPAENYYCHPFALLIVCPASAPPHPRTEAPCGQGVFSDLFS